MLDALPSRLGAMYQSIPTKDRLCEIATLAYHDGEARASLVGSTLHSAGADRFLSEAQLLAVSELVQDGDATALIAEGKKAAETYLSKAALVEKKEAVLVDVKELAAEKFVAPAKAAEKFVAARAAPYLTKVADKKAALVETKEAILADKRLSRALEALAMARDHPTETAVALKASAISLLQYDKVAEYRDYVQETFATDLVAKFAPQLSGPDLGDAAQHGITRVRATMAALSTELYSFPHERVNVLSFKARSLLSELTLQASQLPNAESTQAALASLAKLLAPEPVVEPAAESATTATDEERTAVRASLRDRPIARARAKSLRVMADSKSGLIL
ncbi:hypothetical protein EMIHUDRAFT_241729 [Emiliania huxleyi CCMP1516]|uniref:Uncharacterized protein n=2 Tax=Emiliania huxleyi TaxID=2903 RepID=A0A0D3JBG0_EMIH1|nr:hypothetical protein EMIHUDRAFT_241729 [Emiliania huxleyi CCMP1516]EOD20845.1 hypothetical protein EMIHUDRAFT_241729 [Emiliania huxleyi CCMP1516]|eukprot:XP_005773274.1 hypothetical protein EMIHUDRAFT_241729 [Emiliania huxleyi CCMP1516]